MKKILVFVFISFLVLPLLSQGIKVRVIDEKANVYLEASENSYLVETLEKGTILSLYGSGEIKGNWLNVFFKSEKWGVVTGFIKASKVEIIKAQKITKDEKKEPIKKEEVPKPSEIKKEKKPEIVPKIEKKEPIAFPQEKAQARTKFSIKFNYNMGFSEVNKSISWSEEIYYENASYDIDYKLKKGNSFDVGLGYKFSNSIGIELGIDVCSRNMSSNYSASIPHPLLFNSPRNDQKTGSYKLTENVVYLNLFYSIAFSKFSMDIFGGPAYFLSSTELINEISFSHSYPYETISINSSTEKLEKNSFGFNVGSSLNFYLARSFGIFINAQYFSASADFDPSGDIPGLALSLGGFKAGAGLKILF